MIPTIRAAVCLFVLALPACSLLIDFDGLAMRCTHDGDCAARGLVGATCNARGNCVPVGPAPDASTDADPVP
jgi:hypothetical protein